MSKNMAQALDWLRSQVRPCSLEEREMMDMVEEAIAAYDPERMRRCGQTRDVTEGRGHE